MRAPEDGRRGPGPARCPAKRTMPHRERSLRKTSTRPFDVRSSGTGSLGSGLHLPRRSTCCFGRGFSATLPEMNRFQPRSTRRPQPGPLRAQLRRMMLLLTIAILLVYPLDWIVWRVRVAAGRGMGSVPVTSTTAATLKGNHFEVYSQNTTTVDCSRSLLPEAGGGPCWWLQRHPQAITQY